MSEVSRLFARATAPVLSRLATLDRATWAVTGIIAAFALIRLALAASLGLGVDETYALAMARDWQLSYFDHPPLHYWLAHIGATLFGETRFARLPFIALAAGASWLMFRLTARLFGNVAGFWAVLALNLSLYLSVAAGMWILPDGPLDVCLLAAGYCAAAFVSTEEISRAGTWCSWLAIGFWIGLGALSKYHAVLFGASLLGFVAASPKLRGQFRNPAPYAGILVALLVFSPALIWNAQHGWISFLFQGTRVSATGGGIGRVLGQLAGQCFVLSPWIFVALAFAAKDAFARHDDRYRLCLWLGLPTIVLFTLVPLWGARGFPHWSLPGWLMLFPLLGDWLARRAVVRRWPAVAAALSGAALLILVGAADAAANSGWMAASLPKLFAKGDPTLEMMEWHGIRRELAHRGLLDRGNLYILAANWRDAGKLDQALHGRLVVRVLSDPQGYGEPHGYALRAGAGGAIGSDALMLLRPDVAPDLLRMARPYFAAFETQALVELGRNGHSEIRLVCVLARGQRRILPQPY